MNDSPNREVIVFDAALQLPASQRAAYLDEACRSDSAFASLAYFVVKEFLLRFL